MKNIASPFSLVISINHSTIVSLCKQFSKSNPHITIAVGNYNDMLDRYNLLSKMLSSLKAKTNHIELWNDDLVVLKVDITSSNPKYSLEQVWHKPDYPIHIYGLNPHITWFTKQNFEYFFSHVNFNLPKLDGIELSFHQEDLDIVKINK